MNRSATSTTPVPDTELFGERLRFHAASFPSRLRHSPDMDLQSVDKQTLNLAPEACDNDNRNAQRLRSTYYCGASHMTQ